MELTQVPVITINTKSWANISNIFVLICSQFQALSFVPALQRLCPLEKIEASPDIIEEQ